ncbi:metallophosphoesterase family protein [Clostridium vincentii]|uniref:Calcineurin-like phosphoesterase superfamily domain protein n=1 Tax=Clostridium vincentii TaxID=52704 RepID=A0A2T0BC81_9CLOT|nr:metallophosphoesterase family protein [Clostridium vincentii]PRR81510.1 Calcineurin-like phosphoesterase superfamily domain protein [Clostridium vincentii]
MFTDKRLMEAYNNAKVEYFDENSRYIFFSDSHRGDGSVSDEFSRNQNIYLHALDYYFNNDYVYVEAGDGDELWEYSKFKHIRSAHSDIFLLLKKFFDDKRLIMLYGNHNIYLKTKDYVSKHYYSFYDEYNQDIHDLFKEIIPYEALVLKHKSTGQEILTVHGHQGDFINDQLWIVSMLLMRYFWRYMHVIGFHNPSSPAKNLYKRHKIEKNFRKWIQKHKMMLICGHTHRPRFAKREEVPYFNTGCCIHTKGISGIEILEGKILMVEWIIRADEIGVLQIKRNVMRGPEPIENYDFKTNEFLSDK